MELYLIRHGQSTNNARWETLDGRSTVPVSDPTLTEKGVRQAELLAEFLALFQLLLHFFPDFALSCPVLLCTPLS